MIKALYTIIFLSLGCLAIISCSSEKKSETPAEPAVQYYENVPNEKMKELYMTADKCDVIFNDIAVSMNQTEKADVQSQITLMQPGKVPVDHNCSETASIIYQSEGKVIGDARMYLRGKCNYVIFYEENKPMYAATISETGMNFYRRILASGESTTVQ